MCGINGLVSEKLSAEQRLAIVQKMNNTLAHRGPDSSGVYDNFNTTLGHRRLSIIDLSDACNQPFYSADKRFVIVYNGELYNYRELKHDLQRSVKGSNESPYFFKTQSDTEVVLAAFIRWGKKCLDLFNGMYAFAIYDSHEKKLFICRDRLGVKPLYYAFNDDAFIFSSEIRPIIHSGVRKFGLNKEVLDEYLMFQTVFAPNTIIKGIKVLMPGHYMEYSRGKLEAVEYYSTKKINPSPELSYKETCDKVLELLSLSVQRRLVADVPFGAFLSGGIDSSAIVALMSKVSEQNIQTFNINFDESRFSESQYARQIAKKYNTTHHEINLSPSEFLKDLPEALSAMDHPGGDGPNTYVVAKATKKAGITMALSGVGGDELFAGYDVFKRMDALKKKAWLNRVPLFLRRSGAGVIARQKKTVSAGKIAEVLSLPEINFKSVYPLNRSLFTHRELAEIVNNPKEFNTLEAILKSIPQKENFFLSAVSMAEINTYLQNILLRDADQMGMAVALEIREPFLDHKLIEFVLGVKDDFKFPHTPKKLLVDSLGDLLPSEIVNRPKMGFTFPWEIWLKNDLRSFAEKNMGEFSAYSFLNGTKVYDLWKKFLAGDPIITWSRVWHMIILNNWLKQNDISIE